MVSALRYISGWFVVLPLLSGCLGCGALTEADLSQRYQRSITDAMVAEAHEVSSDLRAIHREAPGLIWRQVNDQDHLLVVTWSRSVDGFTPGERLELSRGDTWVTLVPDIQQWFARYRGATDPDSLNLRIAQLLGLPPQASPRTFVELWVRPADLFRPTPDNEIDDTEAELDFSESVDPAYVEWFNRTILFSYFPPRYPWTRLGYTYDWGSDDTEIGLSEFVVRRNARVVVESVMASSGYLGRFLLGN